MRGIFSAGVLDRFLDQDYCPFDFCLGVSVGSTNLAAWLARQRGRNHRVITDYSCRPEFMSCTRFFAGGHWLDLDWLWEITIREIRLDIATFAGRSVPLHVVATRVADGSPVYVRATAENLEQLLKVSCSVPLLYRDFPLLAGEPMTDGGVADAIPVRQAYALGAREMTVILSHPRGYRKAPPKVPWLIRKVLAETPQLAEALVRRAENYNRALDFIDNPPPDCRLHVIAPPAAFAVGRLTRDQRKLQAGYRMGVEAAEVML